MYRSKIKNMIAIPNIMAVTYNRTGEIPPICILNGPTGSLPCAATGGDTLFDVMGLGDGEAGTDCGLATGGADCDNELGDTRGLCRFLGLGLGGAGPNAMD